MKSPKCDCLVKGKSGSYYYNPSLRRLYVNRSENKQRAFKPVGWFCLHCKKVIIE